jgi:hypothetical protein
MRNFSVCVCFVVAMSTFLTQERSNAQVVFGTEARNQFEGNRDNLGDQFIDFENVTAGPLTNQLPGLTFRSTFNRFGTDRAIDLPVALLPWDFVSSSPKQIVGVRSGAPRYIPDGQNVYEIAFDAPQRRAGLQRPWNTFSLTRFYAGNTLLGEHQNTVNSEFVGYVSQSNDMANWVTRIEIDGLSTGGVFQVGNSDDIFFGSTVAVPEPSSGIVIGVAAMLFAIRRSRRSR